jgi:hypothetical protein
MQSRLHLPPGIDPTLVLGSMTAAYALAVPLQGKHEAAFVRARDIAFQVTGGAIAGLILNLISLVAVFHADLSAADRTATAAIVGVLCALFGHLALFSTLMFVALGQVRLLRPRDKAGR